MPIEFKLNKEKNYFLTKWTGKVTDTEMLNSYKDFFNNGPWRPGMHELADLSEVDCSTISPGGLIALNQYTRSFFELQGVKVTKTAAYCPEDLQFGVIGVYQNLSSESPEDVGVFRDMAQAIKWFSTS